MAGADVTAMVCEIGPGALRLVDIPTASEISCTTAESIRELLAAGTEPLVLVDDRPVSTTQLWRQTIEILFADTGVTHAVLVYPSGWPPSQVGSLDALLPGGITVTHLVRSQLHSAETCFVEIGADAIVVGGAGAQTRVVPRDHAAAAVVEQVCRQVTGTAPVCLDTPRGVLGATELARQLRAQLRSNGRIVTTLDDRLVCAAVEPHCPPPPDDRPPPASRRRGLLVALVTVVAGAVLAGIVTRGENSTTTTELVEGRVTVTLPAEWPVARLVGGPGSDRVQVSAPDDPEALLHITQSQVPTDDLAATAAALRDAMAGEDPAVFVAFNPADTRAGRPAVTYREVRAGHDIEWTVIVEHGVRISIGCQSAPGRTAAITPVCDQAIGSAHGIPR